MGKQRKRFELLVWDEVTDKYAFAGMRFKSIETAVEYTERFTLPPGMKWMTYQFSRKEWKRRRLNVPLDIVSYEDMKQISYRLDTSDERWVALLQFQHQICKPCQNLTIYGSKEVAYHYTKDIGLPAGAEWTYKRLDEVDLNDMIVY